MMSALVLFVEPSTVANFWRLLKVGRPSSVTASSSTAPDLEAPLAHTAATARQQQPTSARTAWQTATVVALLAMAAFHVAFPLRWLVLYPSHPSWTEEGHHGAWHMMLRSKKGWALMQAVDVNGQVRHPKLCVSSAEPKRGSSFVSERRVNECRSGARDNAGVRDGHAAPAGPGPQVW